MEGPAMTVMIPLGGLGSRFAKEGYTMRTKPFVRVLGKEMILWLTDNLNLRDDDVLVIVYNPDFANIKCCMEQILRPKLWDRVRFVELDGPTRGAAETVLKGLEGLDEELRARPVMLCDGDTFYTADIVSKYRAVAAKGSNGVFCFPDDQEKPIYSYIKVPDRRTNRIVDIKEKVKISDLANSGCYSFACGDALAAYCRKVIAEALTQQSQDGIGEFYTSGVIKAMLDDGSVSTGHIFEAIELSKADMQVLGTPAQVEAFCVEWAEQPALRFVFDLDGTLCTAPRRPGDYSSCLPVRHTIDYLRQVKAQGHTVIVATARHSMQHGGNASLAAAAAGATDVGRTTLDWLEAQGVPYDEVLFGQPRGDFYVGALAVCPFQDSDPKALAKQTGVYRTDTVKATAVKATAVKATAAAARAWAGGAKQPTVKAVAAAAPRATGAAEVGEEGFWKGAVFGAACAALVAIALARPNLR